MAGHMKPTKEELRHRAENARDAVRLEVQGLVRALHKNAFPGWRIGLLRTATRLATAFLGTLAALHAWEWLQ